MAQKIVTREELLENAYRIAEENGVSALSIRGLARASAVSVGTVYRYFSAKEELTVAVIQLYFAHAFYERFCHIDPTVGYLDFCRKMYVSMCETLDHFRENWLRGVDALPAAEKAAARMKESEQLDHVVRGLAQVYEHDNHISPDLPEGFTPEKVCKFTFLTCSKAFAPARTIAPFCSACLSALCTEIALTADLEPCFGT